jgi:hypothetical protein
LQYNKNIFYATKQYRLFEKIKNITIFNILQCVNTKGGQTAILVCWSAAQRTTEMLADQRTGKNSGPAPADYRNGASATPLLNY